MNRNKDLFFDLTLTSMRLKGRVVVGRSLLLVLELDASLLEDGGGVGLDLAGF